MKRSFTMLVCGLIAAFSLTACGGGSSSSTSGNPPITTVESTPEETNPENGLPLSKQPDPNAPVLASIIIYVPQADGTLIGQMEAAEEFSGENIMELLAELGVVDASTRFVSLEEIDSEESIAAGPGGDATTTVKNGVLTISNFAPATGVSSEKAQEAIVMTYEENYELGSLELVIE